MSPYGIDARTGSVCSKQAGPMSKRRPRHHGLWSKACLSRSDACARASRSLATASSSPGGGVLYAKTGRSHFDVSPFVFPVFVAVLLWTDALTAQTRWLDLESSDFFSACMVELGDLRLCDLRKASTSRDRDREDFLTTSRSGNSAGDFPPSSFCRLSSFIGFNPMTP